MMPTSPTKPELIEGLAQIVRKHGVGFFLAGLDYFVFARKPTLSLHFVGGQVSTSDQDILDRAVKTAFPQVRLIFKEHQGRALNQPNNLKSFSNLFKHQHIVCDPTGAFERLHTLLRVNDALALQFPALDHMLWEPDTRSFVAVVDDAKAIGIIEARAKRLLRRHLSQGYALTVRNVTATLKPPQGRYVLVCPASVENKLSSGSSLPMRARMAGMAALFSLGSVSSTYAMPSTIIDQQRQLEPGVSALLGLTTLGEKASGHRNPLQALGGLRLYFGNETSIDVKRKTDDTNEPADPWLGKDGKPWPTRDKFEPGDERPLAY